VSSCGECNHFPILLELDCARKRLTSALKFNLGWLEEEDFVGLIKDPYIPCDESLTKSTSIQFESNIKKVKHDTIVWAHVKKQKGERDLIKLESMLHVLCNKLGSGGGFLSKETKPELNLLE
jgi:hypothetical protein